MTYVSRRTRTGWGRGEGQFRRGACFVELSSTTHSPSPHPSPPRTGERSRIGLPGGVSEHFLAIMELRAGIPLISDLKSLQQQEAYRRHTDFNRRFLEAHRPTIQRYGRHWGHRARFNCGAGRWEYPFVADRIIAFAAEPGQKAGLRVLDAGSGVTYFPYFLCDALPETQVICCDSNAAYDRASSPRSTAAK